MSTRALVNDEFNQQNLIKAKCMNRLLFTMLIFMTFGCTSRDEVARIKSPDGRVDAVLLETNGGATTSFGYDIFITPSGSGTWRGKEVANLYGAIRNENAYGVNLIWTSIDELAIEFLKARQQELVKPTVALMSKRVKVTLQAGITDPKAPSGGMLYNLKQGGGVPN